MSVFHSGCWLVWVSFYMLSAPKGDHFTQTALSGHACPGLRVSLLKHFSTVFFPKKRGKCFIKDTEIWLWFIFIDQPPLILSIYGELRTGLCFRSVWELSMIWYFFYLQKTGSVVTTLPSSSYKHFKATLQVYRVVGVWYSSIEISKCCFKHLITWKSLLDILIKHKIKSLLDIDHPELTFLV